ncbi:MAG: DUF2721 domain-containing protein [Sphingopyxis sp.]|nr:DUF2721 domain-containing protein [Sphingopyxis sp.]
MPASAPLLAQTIQLVVAPAFLLVGIGNLLGVFAGRLARVLDRSRALAMRHGETVGVEHQRIVEELRVLDRRMDVVNHSIFAGVASGVIVCLLVACMFIQQVAGFSLSAVISVAFVVAMLLLMTSLALFLIEVRLAVRVIHVPTELLERD